MLSKLNYWQFEFNNGGTIGPNFNYNNGGAGQVIVAQQGNTTGWNLNTWYHVGSKNEKPGKTGFAHLFEHLMFMGSGHVKPGVFDESLEEAGGTTTMSQLSGRLLIAPSSCTRLVDRMTEAGLIELNWRTQAGRDVIGAGVAAVPAGATLVETDLSAALGISRTPLRESLKLLAAEGLVELHQNRSARVPDWTPEEILADVQRTASGVNLSTIYRNLEVLEEVGLVTHAHIGHGAPTYHSVDDHVHIHLVCDVCGDVQSIDAVVAEPFLDELRTRTGFVTDVSHVALHGHCGSCSTASTH